VVVALRPASDLESAVDLDLLYRLRALEVALHEPAVRGNPVRVRELATAVPPGHADRSI
jgi:hypothetical protein